MDYFLRKVLETILVMLVYYVYLAYLDNNHRELQQKLNCIECKLDMMEKGLLGKIA